MVFVANLTPLVTKIREISVGVNRDLPGFCPSVEPHYKCSRPLSDQASRMCGSGTLAVLHDWWRVINFVTFTSLVSSSNISASVCTPVCQTAAVLLT